MGIGDISVWLLGPEPPQIYKTGGWREVGNSEVVEGVEEEEWIFTALFVLALLMSNLGYVEFV